MTIDWWTLGLQTFNVVILVWILARFLFKPVAKIIAERQAAATEALDEAKATRLEAQTMRKDAEAEKAALAARRAELLKTAQDDARREKDRLLDEARAAADKARADTRDELARMRGAAVQEVTKEAEALAAEIAARLVARLPENARIDGFIDGLVEAVIELPEATRASLGADGTVHLRAARTPTQAERKRLEDRLSDLLGRSLTLDIEEDPTLIAGLELDAPHAIVRNHFRADLNRITAELAAHD